MVALKKRKKKKKKKLKDMFNNRFREQFFVLHDKQIKNDIW